VRDALRRRAVSIAWRLVLRGAKIPRLVSILLFVHCKATASVNYGFAVSAPGPAIAVEPLHLMPMRVEPSQWHGALRRLASKSRWREYNSG